MTTKSSTKGTTDAAQDSVERILALNERIVEGARRAGTVYLEAYERALSTIAGYQETLATATPFEWLQGIIEAQAAFTREIGDLYSTTAREALQKR